MNEWDQLTPKQKETCRYFLEFTNDREKMAAAMDVTIHTIKSHLNVVYQVFGLTEPGVPGHQRGVVKLMKLLCELKQEGVL